MRATWSYLGLTLEAMLRPPGLAWTLGAWAGILAAARLLEVASGLPPLALPLRGDGLLRAGCSLAAFALCTAFTGGFRPAMLAPVPVGVETASRLLGVAVAGGLASAVGFGIDRVPPAAWPWAWLRGLVAGGHVFVGADGQAWVPGPSAPALVWMTVAAAIPGCFVQRADRAWAPMVLGALWFAVSGIGGWSVVGWAVAGSVWAAVDAASDDVAVATASPAPARWRVVAPGWRARWRAELGWIGRGVVLGSMGVAILVGAVLTVSLGPVPMVLACSFLSGASLALAAMGGSSISLLAALLSIDRGRTAWHTLPVGRRELLAFTFLVGAIIPAVVVGWALAADPEVAATAIAGCAWWWTPVPLTLLRARWGWLVGGGLWFGGLVGGVFHPAWLLAPPVIATAIVLREGG